MTTVTTGRIDLHQHLVPRGYREAFAAAGGEHALPQWSPSAALAMMDEHLIATGVLSLSTPGTHFGDDAAARQLTERINDDHAELVKDRPDRFGMFATLPLPDVDGALAALSHAYDDLRTDGVILLANYQGTYLGDPAFDPVFAELDRRGALVLVHPAELPGPSIPGLAPPVVDFLLDTTRAAVNLVLHGVASRYPHVRMILSHAGGFLPYAAHRIANLTGANELVTPRAGLHPGLDQEAVLEGLRGFWFDTALSGSPSALPSLLAFARPGHVVFGSDWPFTTPEGVDYFTSGLDAYPGLDAAGHASVDRGNAEALLPRLAG
ncbi:amidohydrolase [Streptomyces albus subsp. chlorinus]|uniref:amidohydrolase family protein n=1 Tax=Streptomyces albus TaxID=1888 RepID=UPI0015700980|nr:amidohydrolase family protein [Streptomyces albus]NSC19823.1 amidohydrolase [Streptomyces albus subsp. chlorinus]